MAIQRHSNLEFNKWTELRRALNKLIDEGTYESLVRIHSEVRRDQDGDVRSLYRMHGSMSGPIGFRRFLPWHRAYLIALERELRKIDDSLSIPYWDWNADGGRLIGFRNFLGLSTGRELGSAADQAPEPGRTPWFTSIDEVQSFTHHTGDYYTFASFLERNPHNRGHVWVGGDMNTMASPRDPVFWFHHAQVDRIWAHWQKTNPGEKAFLSGEDAKLQPWGEEFNIESINDISNLDDDSYTYVDPPS